MVDRRSFLLGASAAALVLPTIACDTSWIQIAIDDLPVIEKIFDSIVGIAGIATGNPLVPVATVALINLGFTGAKVALETIQQTIVDYKAHPDATAVQKIAIALSDLQSHVAPLLSGIRLQDPNLQSSISTGLALVVSIVSSISFLLPKTNNTKMAIQFGRMSLVRPIVLANSDQLKSMYNAVVVMNGHSNHQVN